MIFPANLHLQGISQPCWMTQVGHLRVTWQFFGIEPPIPDPRAAPFPQPFPLPSPPLFPAAAPAPAAPAAARRWLWLGCR